MLFDRIKRPIQLTSDGATILELITPIVNALTSLETYVVDPKRHGPLTVAACSDLVLHYLTGVIQVFRVGFPEVHVRLLDRP